MKMARLKTVPPYLFKCFGESIMKKMLACILAITFSSVPLILSAQEIFSISHPTVTGDSVTNVYSYLDASNEERMRALFPEQPVFRPGIVSVTEIVAGIDVIFHPGAVLVMDSESAQFVRDRLEAMGEPGKLTIVRIAE
jgi:hypothetical protein